MIMAVANSTGIINYKFILFKHLIYEIQLLKITKKIVYIPFQESIYFADLQFTKGHIFQIITPNYWYDKTKIKLVMVKIWLLIVCYIDNSISFQSP